MDRSTIDRYRKVRAHAQGEGPEADNARRILQRLEAKHPGINQAAKVLDDLDRRAEEAKRRPPVPPNPFRMTPDQPFPDFPRAQEVVDHVDGFWGAFFRSPIGQRAVRWADAKIDEAREAWNADVDERWREAESTKKLREEYFAMAKLEQLLENDAELDIDILEELEKKKPTGVMLIELQLTVPVELWKRIGEDPETFVEWLDEQVRSEYDFDEEEDEEDED